MAQPQTASCPGPSPACLLPTCTFSQLQLLSSSMREAGGLWENSSRLPPGLMPPCSALRAALPAASAPSLLGPRASSWSSVPCSSGAVVEQGVSSS